MNTTISHEKRTAQRQGGAYQAEFGRTQAGSLTIQIRPEGAKGARAQHRLLAALVYQLAAELELRSRHTNERWVISPDTSNGRLVMELLVGDCFEFQRAVEMAEHALVGLHITTGGAR
jgi:hypothetical protein